MSIGFLVFESTLPILLGFVYGAVIAFSTGSQSVGLMSRTPEDFRNHFPRRFSAPPRTPRRTLLKSKMGLSRVIHEVVLLC